jgi:hypothetical protein
MEMPPPPLSSWCARSSSKQCCEVDPEALADAVERLSLGGSQQLPQQAATETPKQTRKDPPPPLLFVLEVQEQGPNCLYKLFMVPFPLLVTFASILNAFIAAAGFRRDEERA